MKSHQEHMLTIFGSAYIAFMTFLFCAGAVRAQDSDPTESYLASPQLDTTISIFQSGYARIGFYDDNSDSISIIETLSKIAHFQYRRDNTYPEIYIISDRIDYSVDYFEKIRGRLVMPPKIWTDIYSRGLSADGCSAFKTVDHAGWVSYGVIVADNNKLTQSENQACIGFGFTYIIGFPALKTQSPFRDRLAPDLAARLIGDIYKCSKDKERAGNKTDITLYYLPAAQNCFSSMRHSASETHD